MASFSPKCDICISDNRNKSASVWCSKCDEAICSDCEKQHGLMGITKNHETIPIEDYKKLPLSVSAIDQNCKRHSLKLDFYCLIHNERCCVSCISEKHGTCNKLKPLSEVVEGVKSSEDFKKLEDKLKDIIKTICSMIMIKENNQKCFRDQKKKIISEVQNVRTTINNHLDKLQKDFMDKLCNVEKEKSKDIDDLIAKLYHMQSNVEKISSDLKTTKQYSSDYQAFLSIHEWNQNIEIEETNVMSLKYEQSLENFEMAVKFSPILLNFEKDVREFGELIVKYSTSMNLKRRDIFKLNSVSDYIKLTIARFFQDPQFSISLHI